LLELAKSGAPARDLHTFCSVDAMASGAKRVMEGVLKLVDALDLYGSVAIPKHHTQQDVSDIYACALPP